MNQYDKECVTYFFEHQSQLFGKNILEDMEEAQEFLEDSLAVVCKNIKEVRAYFEEEGADIAEMSNEELKEASEVFALPDGRFLVIEG